MVRRLRPLQKSMFVCCETIYLLLNNNFQNIKQRTATVSVHGVRPPKETEIDGLKGWQHDVSSGKIHVLNCNTMLISNFTYTGAGKTGKYNKTLGL